MKNNLLIFIFIILFFCSSNSFSKIDNSDLLKKISKNIRCLICQGQSIDDSNSEFAIAVKHVILKKLDKGIPEKEIYKFLQSKYGDWIVYKPQFRLYNLFLWLTPYIIFLGGGLLIFFKVIRKKEKSY